MNAGKLLRIFSPRPSGRSTPSLGAIAVRLATVLLLGLVTLPALAQTLTATVDRRDISIDETLNLTVRYTGNTNGQPDFSALSDQFEILNQSQSNQFRSINGRVESYTEWNMVVAPRQIGRLLIPSFKFGGVFSDAVEVNVSKSAPIPAGTRDLVFLETVVDKPEIYVQEQLKLTLRFYYSVNVDALDREPVALDNVIVESLPDASYRRNINGVPYNVAEFNYVLYPQSSGELTIPAMRWTAKLPQSQQRRSIFDLNTGRYDLKRLRTEQKQITVKARPAAFPVDATWLPSTNVTLDEQWNRDPDQFKVGEPITRTLTLKAEGLMASQLPAMLNEPTDNRLKYYPDQPVLDDEKQGAGITAERTETAAVVVSEGGEITVPAVRIPWWDVTTDTLKYAEIPMRRFIVAASDEVEKNQRARSEAIETNNATATDESGGIPAADSNTRVSYFWVAASALLLISTVVFALLWWFTRAQLHRLTSTNSQVEARRESARKKEKQAWQQVLAAGESADLSQLRDALLTWGRLYFPAANIKAIKDISRQINIDTLDDQLLKLDAALYNGKSEQWHPAELMQQLSAWRQSATVKQKKGEILQPLYAD